MITAELYRKSRPTVVVTRDSEADSGAWARLQTAYLRGVVGGAADRIDVRADVFLAELSALRETRLMYQQAITIGPTLESQLRALATDRKARESASIEHAPIDVAALEGELKAAGFTRKLMPFQIDNLAAILRLSHGADFSVPGAGKTTVALANFALGRARRHFKRMLCIGPIAAFGSWQEDAAECLSPKPVVTVYAGSDTVIPNNTDILLTNYNRVASDYDRIREYVGEDETQIVLDEAHRIKRGTYGVHGRAVLDLAYAAQRRDVLTGTPAPQSAHDVIALMRFLYPGQDQQILPASVYNEKDGREDSVLRETSAAIARYFVRTPKSLLNLPDTTFDPVVQDMGPLQRAIYDALIGTYRGAFPLKTETRHKFDRLGRITMYLLEAATNPMLLIAGSDAADEAGFVHPPVDIAGNEPLADLLARYREYEVPWKYQKIKAIVAEAAAKGEKVLVWSTFVRNLKSLARFLEEFNPAMVHGGVPSVEQPSPDMVTRTAELNRFRHDPACTVLLANPAACGEGVNLHHWCHHAVYLDRTFNAGHFLQSQDRIHRLGLDKNQLTKFTILVSKGSIDETVDGRLREKVKALAILMNDPGLVKVALPETDVDHSDPPAFTDDFAAVEAHIAAGASAP